ncbi:MAG: polysaccharide biosynthesis tyrosine autokinase [Candidatus Omnitrophica bacterium]|nr:polysaccharide biosynthesis tyrosine autokinase [Candidatus Omnitrophota bacterium]
MDADRFQYVEEEIEIRHYLNLLRRHYKAALSTVIISVSLAAIYAFKLPNIYQAETQIMVQKEAEPTPYTELKDPTPPYLENVYFNTQIEVLKSSDLLGKAIRDGQLLEPLALAGKIKPRKDVPAEKQVEAAVNVLRLGLAIDKIRDTRILILRYKSTNAILAKEVVNAVARAYIRQNVEEKLYIPKELLQFFPEDAEKIQVETPYGQLQKVSQEDIAKTLPSVVNDPLIRQLQSKAAEAESQLGKLRETFKEKHPKVVEAKSTLKFIKDRIKTETENIVRNLKTTLASQLQVSNVRILKQAEVPQMPVGPNRLRILLIAALGSAAAFLGLIFTLDFLDDSIKSQEDIEKFVQLPFLGNVPIVKEKIKDIHQKAFFVHYNPLSDVAESFRFVKIALNFSGAPGALKCLVITSAVPSEGKSMFSTNLISSFLRDGERVLLVDADLRHPTVHLFTNTDNLKGLSNFLSSNMEFDEVLQKTNIPQLDVIPAGLLSPNPTELFASYRMEAFIREAKARYEHIIIDSPPIIGLADSLVIGTKCDGAILLIQARHVSRNLIKKAKQRLLETGIKVLGVILNKVDLEREDPAYRYFAQGYYHYYGKKKDSAAGPETGSTSG